MVLSAAQIDRVRAPSQLDDLGVPPGLAEDLFMRRVLTDRVTTIGQAAHDLCVTHAVANEIAGALRDKALLEFMGVNGRDYRVQLTERGVRATTQRMQSGRHVGPMPVPLALYQEIVEAQQPEMELNRMKMEAAFADLYVQDDLLDQIGPAFVSGGAIFLYGPAGTGKTSLAERMNRMFDDPVLIPRYIETDSQIVSVYDPALHEALPEQPPTLDRRWVLCRRPLILVGGELDLSMLDLRYDRVSGISLASIGMLANNGILVVDDFGRQSFRPEEILNRWIVPLSRGVDFLKAATGTKLTVPFELKLVISTNLDPNSLGDDAFLRRLRNKIYVGPISDEGFAWVLADAADHYDLELTDDAADHLGDVARRHLGELRPYLAVDFCQTALAVCNYEGWDQVLDPDMIDRVADLYFVQDEAKAMEDRMPARWTLGFPGPARSRDSMTRWNDYELGHVFDSDPLEGLEELAATLSVEEPGRPGEVPSALRPAAAQGASGDGGTGGGRPTR